MTTAQLAFPTMAQPDAPTESDLIDLWIPGTPQPGGSKRAFLHPHTKRIIVKDDAKRGAAWRDRVAAFAIQLRRELFPRGEPIAVCGCFVMPRVKGHFRTGKHAGELRPDAPRMHTVKPDLTKLWRSTEDAQTGIVWADDSAIAMQVLVKTYGDHPGVRLWMWAGEGIDQPERVLAFLRMARDGMASDWEEGSDAQ